MRGIVKVVTAVANGDLSQKLQVEAKGEIAALADTLNSMTDDARHLRRAGHRAWRAPSASKASWARRPRCPGVAGTWKDLTDNVNLLANNLTAQVRNIAEVTTAVANGDLSKKITVDAKGEVLELKNTINTMVDQLELVRRRGHARRQGGRHRGKARRPGRRAGASPAPGRT